ncbi:MAG: hypothetical protein K2M22_06275 [Lachnospiraceae bacterium]|nr:hypothetical protein [Lachnospiraceae bacterium]
MSGIEIVLIVVGVVILIVGYLLRAGKRDTDEEVQLISEAEIRKLVEGEAETVRERVSEIVDETIGYSIEKTERAMERVANEKIMAVNEYSDTVLEEINKNHKEVTFLYDMLNDKHDTLMVSIGQASQAADEIRQTIRDAEITADETIKKAKSAEEAADEAIQRIRNAEFSAKEAQEAVQEAVQSVMGAVEDTRTDLWTIHSARNYSPEVEEAESFSEPEPDEEEYQEFGREPLPEEMYAPEEMYVPEEAYVPEEVEFTPIRPKRVEIIHEPEADYVAEEPDISTSAAFAELGIFGNARGRGPAKEEPRGVDIRFAQGQNDGHNSNERILELHKAGKSNMAIAKELGLGLGEVKLVIDLFEGV